MDEIDGIARRACTASQLARAWVVSQGEDIGPIPGTTRRSYLEENAAAARVSLTAVSGGQHADHRPVMV